MRLSRFLSRSVPGFTGIVLFVVLLAANAVLAGHLPSPSDLANLVQVGLPLALAAFAQGIPILTGGIDLSIGGVMSLVNVVIVVGEARLGFGAATLLAVLLATLVGLVNGAVVVYGRVAPLVATLAVSFVTAGVALSLLPQPGGSIPGGAVALYEASYLGVPTGVLFLLLLFALWLLVKARWGLPLYAAGGSEAGAVRNGVDVGRVRLLTYTASGFLAGLAGVALTMEIASGDASVGASFVLPSVAAVVLGGTRLSGGFGGLVGPVLAAFGLTEVNNVVFSSGVSSFYESIVASGVVLVGLALANLLRRRTALQRT